MINKITDINESKVIHVWINVIQINGRITINAYGSAKNSFMWKRICLES